MLKIEKTPFGVFPTGEQAHKFTLTNAKGHSVGLTDLGASICSITVPDKSGKLTDVVLHHDSFENSVINKPYFGAVCGRVAGRITDARFELNGKTYSIATDNPECSLHGGKVGFSHKVWEYELMDDGVKFTLVSPDGDQGFPGTLTASVTYKWSDDDRLSLDYSAVTDADTIINLTNHVYFNLNGHGTGNILGHTALFDCDKFSVTNANICPTGELRDVKGTNLDFTGPHTFGERIDNDDEQLKYVGGYDFSFCLRNGEGVRHCARVTGDKSGISIDTYTDRPVVHLYTGNMMDERTDGKEGTVYGVRDGFCLETQNLPDAINRPEFPSSVLRKGDEYRTRTVYAFNA